MDEKVRGCTHGRTNRNAHEDEGGRTNDGWRKEFVATRTYGRTNMNSHEDEDLRSLHLCRYQLFFTFKKASEKNNPFFINWQSNQNYQNIQVPKEIITIWNGRDNLNRIHAEAALFSSFKSCYVMSLIMKY